MKILHFVLCDDVRHEAGGKVSLMGVLDPSIKLLLPSMSLGVYVVAETTVEESPSEFALKVTAGEATLADITGPIPAKQSERIKFAGKVEQIPVPGPCELIVHFALMSKGRIIGEDLRTIRVTPATAT